MGYKLNLGSGRTWKKDGWITVDHAISKKTTSWKIPLPDESCDIVFTSHMVEHISHYRIEETIIEINRVLKNGGKLRILTPNLYKLARAYANNDIQFFEEALTEDDSIRPDLGLGGKFMNFIVSPGGDSYLFNKNLTECIGGYAHLYCYDFGMMQKLLSKYGFEDIVDSDFLQSGVDELREPLHYSNQPPRWRNMDEKHALEQIALGAHPTGFDRDPATSLYVEATKVADAKNMTGQVNQWKMNQYGLSFDPETNLKIRLIGFVSEFIYYMLLPARFIKRKLVRD